MTDPAGGRPDAGTRVPEAFPELLGLMREIRDAVHAGSHKRFLGWSRESHRALNFLRHRAALCAGDLVLALSAVPAESEMYGWAQAARTVAAEVESMTRRLFWRLGRRNVDAVCEALEALAARCPGAGCAVEEAEGEGGEDGRVP